MTDDRVDAVFDGLAPLLDDVSRRIATAPLNRAERARLAMLCCGSLFGTLAIARAACEAMLLAIERGETAEMP